MASQDVRVVNWADMEATLRNTFTSVFRDSDKKEGLSNQINFASVLEDHKRALVENTEKISSLTQAIQNISGGIGGGAGNRRVSGIPNVPTPQPGETGAAVTPEESQSRLRNAYERVAQKHPVLDKALPYYLGRMTNKEGGLAQLAGVFSPTGGRNLYNAASYAIQSSVDRRVTNPTQLGMMAGYQGPGYEGISGTGSSFGSYLSGAVAAPSLLFSGGTNPNLFGQNLFGTGMSQAQSEGWKTQYRAFTKSLNPFDMLSYDKAMQINQGVSQSNFRNLGEQMNVEDAVTDIVMKTGIEVGAAIDAMDLAIKRLKVDTKEAAAILKEVGPLAKGAGKNISEFVSESSQVTSRLNALGGRGGSTMMAGQIYSSFTGLEGSNVEAFLGGQNMTGILAANIMAGGPGAQFGNAKDMMKLAMGFGPGMGDGQGADDVAISQIESMMKLVDQVSAQTGGDKDMAMFMVANMTGQDPYTIQEIYKQGPKVIAQTKSRKELQGFATGFGEAANLQRGKRAISGEGQDAFKEFQRKAGGFVDDIGIAGWKEGIPGLPTVRTRKGIDFDTINLGGPVDDFEIYVKDIYDARMRGDKQGEEEARQRAAEGGAETEAMRAASLLMQAGRGNEKAWKSLNTDFGLEMGDWVSDETDEGLNKEWKTRSKEVLDRAVSSGVITSDQRKNLQNKIGNGIKSAEDFQNAVNEAMGKKAQDENKVEIGLSEDAKKWFNVFNKAANSAQGKVVMVAPPGVDNRATPNPGGP